MFKLNFSKILPDFSLRKEKTDLLIYTWKNQNKAVYADFKRGIGKVAEGDFTTLYNMYAMMKDCVPPEAQSFYDWFLTLFTQNPSQLQRMMSGNVQWAGKHTEKIAQCLVNRQLWLGINLKTGKVDIYKSCQKGLLMVKSGTPVETWNRLPQMPIRDGWARNVFIITSGENMAIHAAANIATAVETFAERGYARLGGIILNARDVPREAEKVEELACDLNTTIVGRLPRSAEVQEADALGLTVLEHAPSSGMADRYRELARRLVEACAATRPEPARGGFTF